MKRNEMIAQMQETLQESVGSLGAPALFRYSYLLNRAADLFATQYKCMSGSVGANLVEGQVLYPSPTSTAETASVDVIEISAITCYDSSGNLRTLDPTTVPLLDDAYPGWRLWQAQSCPLYAATSAQNEIILTPAPNYNSAYDPTFMIPGGFSIEGIVVPAHSWDASTAECPLPTILHPAVVDHACLLRTIQNPTKDNIARRPMIKDSLQELADAFENANIRFTPATRVPAYITGNNHGASPLYGFNPLDL